MATAKKTTTTKATPEAKLETPSVKYRANGTVEINGETFHAGDILPGIEATALADLLACCIIEPVKGGAAQ